MSTHAFMEWYVEHLRMRSTFSNRDENKQFKAPGVAFPKDFAPCGDDYLVSPYKEYKRSKQKKGQVSIVARRIMSHIIL